MTDDLDRLDKLAEAATPGPWEERKDDADVMHVVHDQERISYVARIGGAEEAYAIHDAEFIAAANPKVVRALVQRVRDADERVSELEKMLSNYTREYRRECNKRLRAGAERDAALEAIERVRETLTLHNPNGRLVKEVLSALDGAPEPEFEYTWAGTDSEGDDWVMDDVFTTRDSAESYLGRPIGRWVATDNGELVRRRKAGPWLPVKGEKP